MVRRPKGRVRPKIVQELLGHVQIWLPLDTYCHILSGIGDGAVTAIQALLSEPEDGDQAKGVGARTSISHHNQIELKGHNKS